MPGKHILIIDDDQDVHEALKLILQPAGYRLTSRSTGPEGMEAVRADPPDLILLDIMLSSPSEGFHLAYELKRDDELARIPMLGDPSRLLSVIENLLDNSVKATSPGQTILVRTSLEAGGKQRGSQVCLEVVDEGRQEQQQGLPAFRTEKSEDGPRLPRRGIAGCRCRVRLHGWRQ